MVQWSVCLEGLVPLPHQDMDRAQLLDLAFDSLPVPKQSLRLLRCAERKAGQTRASWSPGLNEEVDGKTRRRALGPASCKSTISERALLRSPLVHGRTNLDKLAALLAKSHSPRDTKSKSTSLSMTYKY